MAIYHVRLFDETGTVQQERLLECAHDDEAIDRTGDIDHPLAMEVWTDGRQVAHFPPLQEAGSPLLKGPVCLPHSAGTGADSGGTASWASFTPRWSDPPRGPMT